MRKRLIICDSFMGPEIRDAAAPDEPGVLIGRDGSVSATGLVSLLNRLLPAPAGDLRCGGSRWLNRSGVKGAATCPECGQTFAPTHAQDGPWRAWALPEHNQPEGSP